MEFQLLFMPLAAIRQATNRQMNRRNELTRRAGPPLLPQLTQRLIMLLRFVLTCCWRVGNKPLAVI